ncbi:MAG: hypothetical protein Q4C55_09930, partial [Eubacterium sp.]|nr:hypothetical protein [Eubacterium sp.]
MTAATMAPAMAVSTPSGDAGDQTPAVTQDDQVIVTAEFRDADTDELISSLRLVVADGTTSVHSSEVKAPEGYEIAITGDAGIVNGVVTFYVRKAEAKTQTVGLNYFDSSAGKQADEVSVEVAADAVTVDRALVEENLPAGYVLAEDKETYDINGGYVWIEVEAVKTQTVKANFFDEDQDKSVGESEGIEIPADETTINTSKFADYVPEGYEIAVIGDVQINDGWAWVVVRKVEKAEQTVQANFFDEDLNKSVGTGSITLPADATTVNTTKFEDQVPEGYELAVRGDVQINDGWAYVVVRKAEQNVKVYYVDQETEKQVGEGTVTVDKGEMTVNTGRLTDVPAGYEIAVVGDYAISNGAISVIVRPVATTKIIKLNYYDEEAEAQVAEVEMEVDKDATYVNTSAMKGLPKGYEIAVTGDLEIRDGYVYVKVNKVPEEKMIILNYYDAEAGKQVQEVQMMVDVNAAYVNTSDLPQIDGYEFVLVGDLPIYGGYVYVEVREAAKTQTVKINYFDNDAYKQIHEETLTVDKDATYVNTGSFKEIPEGYELAEVGDLPIRDGYVYAEVRKIEEPQPETQEIKINYFDEEAYAQVHEETMTVDADATYVNTGSFAEIPEGYELVEVGDLPIRDGYVYAAVRKVEEPKPETQEIKINYYDEDAEAQVHEESMTVDADATYVNTGSFAEI